MRGMGEGGEGEAAVEADCPLSPHVKDHYTFIFFSLSWVFIVQSRDVCISRTNVMLDV